MWETIETGYIQPRSFWILMRTHSDSVTQEAAESNCSAKLAQASVQNMCAFIHPHKERHNVSVSCIDCLVTDKESKGLLMFKIMADFLRLAASTDTMLFFWRCCFDGWYQVTAQSEREGAAVTKVVSKSYENPTFWSDFRKRPFVVLLLFFFFWCVSLRLR